MAHKIKAGLEVVKKPSKRERILLKRAEREKMLEVTTKTTKVTLECPECHIQQRMTLDEYFTKINYGSAFPGRLRCEVCISRPELMFYRVNRQQIAQAGFNWQRERRGISKPEMLEKIEGAETMLNAGKLKEEKKLFDELTKSRKKIEDEKLVDAALEEAVQDTDETK